MEETQIQNEQSPNIEDITRQMTDSLSAQFKQELSGVEERIGGRLSPIEERFAPKQEQSATPSNWDEMSYDEQIRYISNEQRKGLDTTRSELSSRQDALEAFVAAPSIVDKWKFDGDHAKSAKDEASKIMQELAFKNPGVIRELDDQTRQDIIDVATMRASRNAATISQDLAQGYQKQADDSEIMKIKEQYKKDLGTDIDDEKARRLLDQMKRFN